MSLAPPTITCLFFNDPSLPAFLRAPAGRDLVGDLLVECSLFPSLGYVLNLETPANYPGVAGLLGGVDLGTLAHPSDALPAPILLAAGSPVSIAAVRSALARLTQPDERLRAITLLVPVSDARALGAALAIADGFALAWDATAFPHEELLDFAQWLAAEKFLLSGLHTYTTGAPVPSHAQRLTTLLAPLGARLVALSA
ncbi:MAG: hypothetical protein NTV51_22390 [Verrucomicrobia bacterium]|nr:hypothetical protein [Verrucomicrobiota bacterium]